MPCICDPAQERAEHGRGMGHLTADRRWRRRSGSASGSEGERAEAAVRAARGAALKTYRRFSHGAAFRHATFGLRPLCYRVLPRGKDREDRSDKSRLNLFCGATT
jgi:hypothetical protein